MSVETRNAVIKWARFGQEHGILIADLYFMSGCVGQGLGGLILQHPLALERCLKILELAAVTNWDELEGKNVRIKATFTRIVAIGHIHEDKWLELTDG